MFVTKDFENYWIEKNLLPLKCIVHEEMNKKKESVFQSRK